jgi:uncharacterized protein YndB with AHSA1/START domain
MNTQTAPTLALEVKRVIKAPIARVFEAWTKPELIRQWFCGCGGGMKSAKIDLRVGGQFVYVLAREHSEFSLHGEFREVNPPKRLSFTWNNEESCAGTIGDSETQVTVDFTELAGGTEVRIKHERFTNADSRDRHSDGWTRLLENLEKVLTGK